MEKDFLDNKMMDKIFSDIEKDIAGSKKGAFEKNKKLLCGTLANNKKVSEESLLATMSKRITGIEKQLADSMLSVATLTSENEKLRKELAGISNKEGCSKCSVYEGHIQELDKYIDELNNFIKDNGFMVLKCKPELNVEADLKMKNENMLKKLESKLEEAKKVYLDSEESDHSYDIDKLLPKQIDINVLARRVEEINMLILKDGENSKFEMDSDKIFRLKHLRKEITFYFYKNGIAIDGYNFYDYKSTEAKKILRDILDGFSPYILKKQYPDGVFIKLENKIHMDYKIEKGMTSLGQPKLKTKLSAEEFLNRLPDKVIKNGKIFNIRDEIEKHLVVKRSPYYYATENDEHFLIEKDNIEDICKLKIQILIIDKVITVNVNKNDNLSKLFDFLKKFINSNISTQFAKIKEIQNYVLYQTYPFKSYEYNEPKNIFENNLYPTCFLIFEEKTKLKK
jgi:hypothetical protein